MKVSLRWKLILFSACLAGGVALVFSAVLHLHTKRVLQHGLEEELEANCDEVITVLKTADRYPTRLGDVELPIPEAWRRAISGAPCTCRPCRTPSHREASESCSGASASNWRWPAASPPCS